MDLERRCRPRNGRLSAIGVAAEIDRVRLVLVELETGEEARVEQRGGVLADAAADAVDEMAVDDRSRWDETLCCRTLAHELIDREGLARFDDHTLGEFRNALNVDVAALTRGVPSACLLYTSDAADE